MSSRERASTHSKFGLNGHSALTRGACDRLLEELLSGSAVMSEADCRNTLTKLARMNQHAARNVKARSNVPSVQPARRMLSLASSKFSQRVFLGGLRKDADANLVADMVRALLTDATDPVHFEVELPDGKTRASSGYCYVEFGHEHDVCQLLARCAIEEEHGHTRFFMRRESDRRSNVEVIPWAVDDLLWLRELQVFDIFKPEQNEANRRVFVGALHGLITAHELAQALDIFGVVERVELDHAKCHYPIGSARVTFKTWEGFKSAVLANFVRVGLFDGKRKILQIEPYLVDSNCVYCYGTKYIFYCRDCLDYLCALCWFRSEHRVCVKEHLRPLLKNSKAKDSK